MFGKGLEQGYGDARLADPWLARQQGDLAFAAFCLRPTLDQLLQFMLAAHEVRELRGALGVEAALDRPLAGNPGNGYGLGESLNFIRTEFL